MEIEEVQIPAPRVETVSIRSHYDQCISSFTQLHNCLEYLNHKGSGKQLFPIIGLSTELGRLRVWAGNTGAHQTGLLSLDHRLREVPDVHEEISVLLEELDSELGEIFNLTGYGTSGSLNQWGYPIENDSTEVPSDVGSLQSDDFMSLVNDISHIITCLYKLYIAIRNPVPPDRLHKLAAIDVSHFESKDIKHLSKIFPLAPSYVLERLRRGNTKRRQLLRYYQLYYNKLTHFVDLSTQDDVKPTPSIQLVKRHDEMANTCPTPPEGPGTAPTKLKPRITPSTGIPNEPTGDRIPPPPNAGTTDNGQPFVCPYCCTLISLDNMRSWKKHVYRDLRPYACMHKDCRSWDVLYESQHEWYEHELSMHLREWYCKNCARLFARASEFKEHLLTTHMDIVGKEVISVEEIVELSGRAKVPPELCPFCGEVVTQDMRMKHLSRHMKSFALLALPDPKVVDEDEELQEKEQTAWAQDTDADAQVQVRNKEDLEGTSALELKSNSTREGSLDELTPTLRPMGSVLVKNQADNGNPLPQYSSGRGLRTQLEKDSIDDLSLQPVKSFAFPALPGLTVWGEDEELQEKEQTSWAQDTDADAQMQARNKWDLEETSALELMSNPTREGSLDEHTPKLGPMGSALVKNQADDENPLLHYSSGRGLPTQLERDSIGDLSSQPEVKCIELLKSAAEKGYLEQVTAICTRYQHLLNAEDTAGYTPLHHASRCGHADVVRFLLSRGSHVDRQSRRIGNTPLMEAVSHGRLEVVRLLLEQGADPKKRNFIGANARECMNQYSPIRTAIEEAIKGAFQTVTPQSSDLPESPAETGLSFSMSQFLQSASNDEPFSVYRYQ